MSDLDVSSSDLDLARRLSRQLSAGRGTGAQPVASEEMTGFIRFSASRFQGAKGAPSESVEPSPAEARPPLEPALCLFESWEQLLEWCMALHPARAAFVVDPEGFVIASSGDWSFRHLEGVGPTLIGVLERARQIEGAGRVSYVSLQLEPYWLCGLDVPREGMGDFIVGFFSREAMRGEAQAAILKQIEHNVDRL